MFLDDVPNWEIWLALTVVGGILLPIGYKVEANWSEALFWIGFVLLIMGPVLLIFQLFYSIWKRKKNKNKDSDTSKK